MSTYRERREARAERLREQAARNDAKSDAARASGDAIASHIPMGQPILVGHHSEKRHRRDLARIDRAMQTTVEAGRTADRQRASADEIERQADRAIYDDDSDAIERLRAKLAELEAERERRKQANADYRREHRAELKAMSAYDRHHAVPFPSYSLSNLSGRITATRKRIEFLSQPERPRVIVARRSGDCRACDRGIEPGQTIKWFRRTGEAQHNDCPDPEGKDS
jgi:DNA repair exonuclease SbcCD ATPase subunit